MEDPLVETWEIHNRIHLYLLDAIDDEAIGSALPKCRSVSDLFAHIHNVRLMWIQSSAPELMAGLEKLETKQIHPKSGIRAALLASGQAVATMLRSSIASGGRVKGFKPHVTAFVGYLISHESHHRGQIGWTLKQSGRKLDQKTAFGLWEWGTR